MSSFENPGGARIKINNENSKDIISRIGEAACDNEKNYHGCCRSVLSALQVNLGLGNGTVIKAATALGGGLARTGEACGALLGGLMAIGLVYASDQLDDSRNSPAYSKTIEQSMRLCDCFRRNFGGITCREVQKNILGRYYDLRNPDDVAEFRSSGHVKCEEVIARTAAQLAAEIILGFHKESIS